MSRVSWAPVLERAAAVVGSYTTGVTLRQCFYRLVADQLLPNTKGYYKTLSARSAEARRDGWFPDFIDTTRSVHRPYWYRSPGEALAELVDDYRRDRTEGQEWSVYLGVEKRGIVAQLTSWFGALGAPVLELGGYASQTYVKNVVRDVRAYARPSVLLVACDFDPSGEDIDRDFVERTGCWDKVVRVALNADQVVEYDLPPQTGKATDSRASAFVARHGALVQVELDALPPDVLRGLYQQALGEFWDMSAYERAGALERRERAVLAALEVGQ